MHGGESDVPDESGHSLVLCKHEFDLRYERVDRAAVFVKRLHKDTQARCFIVNSLGRSVFRDCFIHLPLFPQAKAFGEVFQVSCTHFLNEGYKRCSDVFPQDFARHVSLQECICHAYKWSTVPTQDNRSWCEILCNIRRKCLHFPFWCVGMWFYVRCFHLWFAQLRRHDAKSRCSLKDQITELLFVLHNSYVELSEIRDGHLHDVNEQFFLRVHLVHRRTGYWIDYNIGDRKCFCVFYGCVVLHLFKRIWVHYVSILHVVCKPRAKTLNRPCW